ncbi:DUF4102 domain-containing protein [Azospirillum sp. Vi22]|uniref:tyrosine-type recombinase/integrase n=1 Tax=Azospirillum baldaniorum TaxID=1064539 RepID=UPI00157A2512|nr:integrase arm-type DNA-binding domain-containing protein [Azospirillum baldaniorum]NUB06816.1 DUF4102 domain-containing protein [Azospirillum baldaniorum]
MPRLTDTTIRHARAKDGIRTILRDGAGLELQVHPSGTKTWYLRCRVRAEGGGKGIQRRVALGAYPAVSLSDARLAAGRVVSEARSGQDPKATETRAILGLEKPRTVADAATLYIAHLKAVGRAERYWKERERLLKLHLVPALGKLTPADVDRAMLSAVVDREARRQAKARQKGVQTRRLGSVITALWRHLEDKGWLSTRGTADRLLVSAAAERSRDRILSDGELGELALALGLLDGRTIYQREADGTRPISRQTLDAMALALLLGLRAGEVLRIQARDIQEDSETGFVLLRVAAHGGKTAAARRDLPLPPLALSVLRRRQQACGDGPLFPSPSGKIAGALTVDGLACAARLLADKLGHRDAEGRRWTPHDLRRTCASILGEYDTPDAVQKRILGHASDGVTARVYDRSRRLRQMREALMTVEKHTIMQARKAAGLDTEPVRLGG